MVETIDFNDGTLKIKISMDDNNKITNFDLSSNNEFKSKITYNGNDVKYSDEFNPEEQEGGTAIYGGNNKKTRRRRAGKS